LAAFWKLSDESDNGPNGLTLTNNGTATFDTGKIGDAVHLVAASNQYLSRVDHAALSCGASQSLSASLWVRHTTLANSGALNKGSPSAGSGGEWGFEFLSASAKWRFILRNTADTTSLAVTSPVVCTTATWYHLVGWWDAAGKTINIAIDDETPVSAAFAAGGFDGVNDLNIGFWVAIGAKFNGDVDAVGIWNRVLTADERTALYNGGAGREHPF
jgi:hypothetical protein